MNNELGTGVCRPVYEEFMLYAAQIGYSVSTLVQLRREVRHFLMWCEIVGIYDLTNVRPEDTEDYRRYVETRPLLYGHGAALAEASIYRLLYGARLLFDYLVQCERLSANPMSGMRLKSPKSEPREVLTEEEVAELYAVCQRPREAAMLALLYGCALRRSEAARVDVRDVHLRQRLLYVRHGKGGRSRIVPMSTGVVREIQEYLYGERPLLLKAHIPEEALLITSFGTRMKAKTVSEYVRLLALRSQSITLQQKPVHAHILRHSIATHLLGRGMALDKVQEFLGHITVHDKICNR